MAARSARRAPRVGLVALAALLVGAPLAVGAQSADRVPRIGFLSHAAEPSARSAEFVQGLLDLGYVERRDFVIDYRGADGHSERLPALAAELVRAGVDVIVTRGTAATLAAKAATGTVPIVFGSAGAPVEKGLVAGLARPGGNVTGLALPIGIGKALQLLQDIVPAVGRVVHVYDPSVLQPMPYRDLALATARGDAAALGLTLRSVALGTAGDAVRLFTDLDRGTGGAVLDNAGLVVARRDQICRLALNRRLPAVGRGPGFADAGCLASYGEHVGDMYRRAATYVDRILKGTRPSDLPVEQATRFELAINLATARSLGVTIPPSVLLRADKVLP